MSEQDDLIQGIILYRQGKDTVARGRIDGRIFSQSHDSSEVIQNALNRISAHDGGELKIESGMYSIRKEIKIPSRVCILGSGRSSVLKLDDKNQTGVIFIAQAQDEISLSDLVLQGIPSHAESTGLILEQCGDCAISQVHARDFSGYGFWLRGSCFLNKLLHNTTSGNQRAGTLIEKCGMARGGSFVPNLLMGCSSHGEIGHAFEFSNAICVNVIGCTAHQMQGHGYYLHDYSNSVLISGCRSYQGYQNAVMVDSCHELNITGNIFCWHKKNGIELDYVVWATITGNEIIDAGGVGIIDDPEDYKAKSYGILMKRDTKSVQVSGNTIFTWGDGHVPMISGIVEEEDCRDNQITDNIVNHYTEEAALSKGNNSKLENLLGIPRFYTEPWLEPFQPEKETATQALQPMTREKIEAFLSGTRR